MCWIVWELHLLYWCTDWPQLEFPAPISSQCSRSYHLTQLLKSRIRVPVGAVHYLLTLQRGLLPLQFPDDLWPSLRWRLSAIGGPYSRPVYRYADVHFFSKMTRQVTYSSLFLNNKYVELEIKNCVYPFYFIRKDVHLDTLPFLTSVNLFRFHGKNLLFLLPATPPFRRRV